MRAACLRRFKATPTKSVNEACVRKVVLEGSVLMGTSISRLRHLGVRVIDVCRQGRFCSTTLQTSVSINQGMLINPL